MVIHYVWRKLVKGGHIFGSKFICRSDKKFITRSEREVMHPLKYSLVVFLCFLKFGALGQKLNVEVLYESLCPDSFDFIKNQLYPAWNDLAPYVNLKLVPFGKSTSYENGGKFTCQHGTKECVGNRIQSCVLNQLFDQNAQVEYVNCFMNVFERNRRDREELGKSCATKVGVNWEHAKQCYDSTTGTKLQLEAEQETGRFRPTFVPTILYNGVFHQQVQDDTLVDFRGVACTFISQVHPEACHSSDVLSI